MDYDFFDVNAYSSDEEPRRVKIIRPRPNFFEEYDNKDFIDRFRLGKQTVENISEDLEDVLSYSTDRNDALTPLQQLLLFLSFVSNGSFLKISGDFCGVSKSTACKTIKRVARAICTLRPRYIKMPQTRDEIEECREKFYRLARFPGCIGAIDCTHIRIQSPGGDNAEIFRNRKKYFSLNVQTISNADLEIQDIVTRWPGSTHDSYIFRNSRIHNLFENGHFGNSIIIGDSGYAIKNYLLTPLLETRNEAEVLYNESQIRTRNVVERQYGVWKRRFPALAMGLRLNVNTIQEVTVATAILHNIASQERDPIPPLNEHQEAAVNFVNNMPAIHYIQRRIRFDERTRHNFITNHFSRL